MKNNGILFRRILYVICLILSLVFISVRGGNLSYMLFYLVLVNTAVSLIYIVYVFYSVRIFQDIPERHVTKQEFVKYNLKLSNESFITNREVQLRLLSELSEVKGMEETIHTGLEPGEVMEIHGELYCKYSGTYYAGVDRIEIMDYFKIFRIRFPMPQKMKVMVKPRILELPDVAYIMEEEAHDSSLKGKNNYQLDNEVRKYTTGDNKKWIHWRNSAKRQELMVKTPAEEEISEYVVIMDSNIERKDFKEDIIRCDKFREGMVALVHSIYRSGYFVLAVMDCVYEKEISLQRDFKGFFDKIVEYSFGQTLGLDEKISQLNRAYNQNIPFIIVTSNQSVLKDDVLDELRSYRNIKVFNVDSFESVEKMLGMEN